MVKSKLSKQLHIVERCENLQVATCNFNLFTCRKHVITIRTVRFIWTKKLTSNHLSAHC